ncbi:CGA synthase-related protein [Streptomyces platensis]|uniref:CGA synthase-related protein n=1 Tax=Streptomyces platensis TaxID=58346 RepID=UPI0036740393
MAVLSRCTEDPGAPARGHVLLVDEPRLLDASTARRRIAGHLTELEVSYPTAPSTPDVALVCDAPEAAARLSGQGVPVVYLHCRHRATEFPAVPAVTRLVQRPDWLSGPQPTGQDPLNAVQLLAPRRLTRNRSRSGCLVLVSAYEADDAERADFTDTFLRPAAAEAVRRTGHCDVVCDTGFTAVRKALGPVAGVRVHRAADVDFDALHAAAETFLASPTLTAVSLAWARDAPLTLLPPLGPDQRDLADRLRRLVPVEVAEDARRPTVWAPHPGPWAPLGSDDDARREAQRIARRVRQLALIPTVF